MNKVEHQFYYKRNGIEAKDVIRLVLEFLGDGVTNYEAACVYNVMKYLMRYKFKDNPKQDLDKAIVEIKWLKEELDWNNETDE